MAAGSEPASVAEAPAEMPAAPQAASIPTGPEAAPEASKTNDSAPAAVCPVPHSHGTSFTLPIDAWPPLLLPNCCRHSL